MPEAADDKKYQYRCYHADCDYFRQTIVHAVRPGLFPSCHACGRALTLMWGMLADASDCGGYHQ